MKRLALALFFLSSTAFAQADAGAPPKVDAGVRAAVGPVDASAPLPQGHPQVHDDEGDEEDPHAAQQGGAGSMMQAPEDSANEDPSLPRGSIVVQILDAESKPIAGTDVTLGIVYNSVAKGESRKRVVAKTDASGFARWKDLDAGTLVAYRPMVLVEGATFSAPPFQLPLTKGIRATLHVYPIEHDVDKTLIVTQSILYAEVKDDRLQVQQAFKIYNFGKNAWVPEDVVVPLPPEFTAFAAQQGMTDVGVDAVQKKGVRLRGTFTPGQHVLEFKWQLPYAGEADILFDVGMTPHMAASRVIAPASRRMGLEVEGYPTPQQSTDGTGQRALVTERQMRRDEKPLSSTRIHITGLPTEGPAKYLATMLAAGVVALGIVVGSRKPPKPDGSLERGRLLAELEALERAHAAGDVGPKTYERSRREILDAVARTFANETRPPKKKKSA